MDDERTLEQIATDIRDAAEGLNRLMSEAAERGCEVKVEVLVVPLPDHLTWVTTKVSPHVYQRIEPTPRPVERPPLKRGHH